MATVTAINTPRNPADLDAVRALIREYADGLGVDLCFQDLAAELAELPGAYAAPRGALLMLSVDGALAGCCAMRPLDNADHPNACEMKRLFVRPALRGLGLGRLLAESIMDASRRAGYTSIVLDTLIHMAAARAMYEQLGFEEIAPYYHNPIAGSRYLKAAL